LYTKIIDYFNFLQSYSKLGGVFETHCILQWAWLNFSLGYVRVLHNEGSGSLISVIVIGHCCKNWTMIVFFIFSPHFSKFINSLEIQNWRSRFL